MKNDMDPALIDGTWPVDWRERGRTWFDMEQVGEPSKWITLRALRVLRWWDEQEMT